ncbi:hypothetical protein GPX89_26840 [Nocardia sp. ET3-3]|uniref:Ricin B lectin domain-containing protein n=1 Tax=Nocardia terrae TaxID=2675851 RepID=A0A7K1V2X5_9NOCA|nr:hypothetical protein [Nocardia terrae]MVU80857.1 hypothetical protein [Nocardia terrae]
MPRYKISSAKTETFLVDTKEPDEDTIITLGRTASEWTLSKRLGSDTFPVMTVTPISGEAGADIKEDSNSHRVKYSLGYDEWIITECGDGEYAIETRGGGKMFVADDGSLQVSSDLSAGDTRQFWRFKEVPEQDPFS